MSGMLNTLTGRELSRTSSSSLQRALETRIIDHYQSFTVSSSERLFNRRCEIIEFHEKLAPGMAAISSHHGDVALWPFTADSQERHRSSQRIVIKGPGPAGSFNAMKFAPNDANVLYYASIDQSIGRVTMDRQEREHFHTTDDRNHWFQSMDISVSKNILFAGDNKGYAHIFDLANGRRTHVLRLHGKNEKLVQIECHPSDDNIILTAGHDKHLRIWDIRNMAHVQECKPVWDTEMEQKINSASFSPLTGKHVVVTGQRDRVYVYACSPGLDLVRTIRHWNSVFQYMTPIRAAWHPRNENLFVIGSYQSLQQRTTPEWRSVDLLHVDGSVAARLEDELAPGYCPVNRFDPAGEVLLSLSGSNVHAWGPRQEREAGAAAGTTGNRTGPAAKRKRDDEPRELPNGKRKKTAAAGTKEEAPENDEAEEENELPKEPDFSSFAFKGSGKEDGGKDKSKDKGKRGEKN